jgi:FkbM family methyltransferase
MKKLSHFIKKILFKTLTFKQYLTVLSKGFFLSYRLGLLKGKQAFKYHYFLEDLVDPGDVIIDIGANLGYFSKLFSKWTGTEGLVYAVEPISELRDVFEKNLKGRKNIKMLPFALGTENKKIKMGNDTREKMGFIASGSHYVLDDQNVAEDEFEAEMRKGSELFKDFQKINLIKCDVEGYEKVIIPEIEGILKKHKPILFIETKGENRTFISEFLSDIGYRNYILQNNILLDLNTVDAKNQDDIICIHSEKTETVKVSFV